jgi:wobble nucleotide-excising tRNase
MSNTLAEIAQQLKDADKKVQLIYAFNGMGKTRLSREFKKLVSPKFDEVTSIDDVEDFDAIGQTRSKILYYNAFTEDLFYWDNDLEQDAEPKLKIQPNSFTDWIFKGIKDQGLDQSIIKNFQRYTDEKLTPKFNPEAKFKGTDNKEIVVPAFSEVTFSFERGNRDKTERTEIIKISKGEESNFIWSIFYTLLEQVTSILKELEPNNRETNDFDQLEYVFIDDPVSSLDENHLIELAVNLATLIKSSDFTDGKGLKFIITTHSPLFYNVLHNEFNSDDKDLSYKAKDCDKYRLEKMEDGLFKLEKQPNDSPFSYHLFLLSELRSAIENGQLRKYHFNFLRNILEKTSTFLGYKKWGDLLPKTNDGTSDAYTARIINISSHSKHSAEEVADLTDDDKRVLGYLVGNLIETCRYWQLGEENKENLLSKSEYERRTKLDVSDPAYINPSLDHWNHA